MNLSEQQKNGLLNYARRILANIVKGEKKDKENPADPDFIKKAGVFVSLHKSNELRGCIGYIEPIATIWDAVYENTISSAERDYRFSPVAPDELSEIKIEISILTPPKQCRLNDIKPNDGLIIESGGNKATYLPQVWEQLPDKNEFLSSLCLKAGLNKDCWQDEATNFYKYQAIVFSE